ncbi:LysM peptidoglycan-binding domain-containing protein [Parabacteroides sp. 52]|uniref:amino acid ABC transporter substrate-binding protein n=1 Tax=unclassified Parabacteroides TaxID=2649774 RepID=UPI0013D41281|nr:MULTISPECIES: LysM peptidoglycan-binding domain-containing protein [unclassified Parabacteroides]MDH6535291.1 LysM repeat protein [Parabacteroides sp. PM5-20]NDV55854.1 LysM peptidoglycan-binding domain-containing protein [Parabacteroides sp. 52]
MNKFSLFFLLILLLCGSCYSLHSQENNPHITLTNAQGDDIFYHTIERGQTVYAIATMYGIGVEDIYRLNPESRAGIKAGKTLKIPQRDIAIAPIETEEPAYTYHTISPKENLYSLSIKYKVLQTDIIRANPGLSVSTFTIGKNIRIPATRIETLPTTEKKILTKEIEYTAERKETIYRISRKFNISSTELIKHNPQLKNGLKAGMVLKIPVQTEEIVTTDIHMLQEEAHDLLAEPKEIEHVDRIKVALLLPFTTKNASRIPHFVEYYEGMLMAVDSLRNAGKSFELFVFDTGDGMEKVDQILKKEELLQANLIIGAVQNEQIKPVADFAQKHRIKYIIPFTSQNDDVLSNASVFQVNTPHSYLYSNAAQAGCNLFQKDNIVLVHIKDNKEKKDFIQALQTEMEQRNISYKELTYNAETFASDIKERLDPEKRNIVIPSSSSLEALNYIRPHIRTLAEFSPEGETPYRINLFGYPDWQTYTAECLDDFYALNTYIYSNFYTDHLSAEVQDFYRKYKNWYSKNLINTFPKYGILGFDTAMFFFEALSKYGSNFENNLDKIDYKSLQTGFHFERVNNWGGFINTNVFIVQYKNDRTVCRSDIQ